MPDETQTNEEPQPSAADFQRAEQGRAEAERRAMIAEQRAAYAAGAAEAMQAQRRPQAPQGEDPLDRYTKESLTMSPEDARNALGRAMDIRAQAASVRQNQQLEQRLAIERASMEQKFALDMVTAQRPEFLDPRNAPNFAAAMTKAKYEADAQGIQLSPAQLTTRAVQVHDQLFKPQGQRTPFVEGQSRPDLQQQQQQGAPPPNTPSQIEKWYGAKPGMIRPPYDINDHEEMNALNMEYLHGKNDQLFKRGALSSINSVLATKSE